MTLNEYQIAAFRTCPDLGLPYKEIFLSQNKEDSYNLLAMKLNLNHMISGMNSELSELHDAELSADQINISEEMADVMWYIAGYCTFRTYDLQYIAQQATLATKPLSWYIQELTDLVKKFTAYNKSIDTKKEVAYINAIVHWIRGVLGEQRFNVAIKNNIDKLRVRYPEKFSDEAAINRNLEAERKELEK